MDVQRGLRFGLIVGVVRERLAHDQQARLIDRHLGVIVLVKALVGAVLHDARVGIGEVVLVLVARPAVGGWAGRPPGVRPLCRRAFASRSCTFASYSACSTASTLFGPRFQHRFGFCQPRQSRVPQGDFVADTRPSGRSRCSARSLRANSSSTSACSCASSPAAACNSRPCSWRHRRGSWCRRG